MEPPTCGGMLAFAFRRIWYKISPRTVQDVPCRSIGAIAGLCFGGERRGVELVVDVVLLAVFLSGKYGAAMLVGFADDSRFDVLWVHGIRVPMGFIVLERRLSSELLVLQIQLVASLPGPVAPRHFQGDVHE